MTDGGTGEQKAEDMTDDDLMVALGAGIEATEAVPEGVVAAAKASFTWRSIDAELAALTFDSMTESPELAGVRSAADGPRELTFEFQDVVVEVEIDVEPSGSTVVGHVTPAGLESVEIQQVSAAAPVQVAADERGRFRAPGVGVGPFRLLCRFRSGSPVRMLMTDWVTI
jgi:hypothetical protein